MPHVIKSQPLNKRAMSNTEKSNISNTYFKLLNQQQFVAEELDYSNFNNHIPVLQALATIGNSGISVFDVFKKEHIFYSPNFCTVLGYNLQDILSQREIQILQMVKDGYLSKEISDKLAISVHTVNTHRQRLLQKLGANNSMEAVVFASKLGLV
jgi:DNA-binding CsgD family transcriptional regulator